MIKNGSSKKREGGILRERKEGENERGREGKTAREMKKETTV